MATNPRRTFVDDEVEDRYRADGYVVVPVLDGERLRAVRALASPLVRTVPDQFAATLYDDDVAHRTLVDRTLRPAFATAFASVLHGQRCFVANLLAKPPGPGTDLGVHQDWTFVDEPELTSATAWCPLVDTDEGNGTLVVFAGSHRLAPSWRGSPRLPSPFDGLEADIRAGHGTVVDCPAGSAVVYDHRLVHWSGPNTSDEVRLAVGVGIAPAGVALVHLHADADGVVTRYEVPDDFLDDLAFGAPPARSSSARRIEVPAHALAVGDLGAAPVEPEPVLVPVSAAPIGTRAPTPGDGVVREGADAPAGSHAAVRWWRRWRPSS